MDVEVIKVVAQFAGIGGISLGILLILFKEIIRKNIFPSLTKQHAYSLLKLIAILIWSIAIIGIFAWVYIQESTSSTPLESLAKNNMKGMNNNFSMEKKAWAYIENTKYPDNFIDFVNKYPESQFVKLAKTKLKILKDDILSKVILDDSSLMWERKKINNLKKISWRNATAYCNNLELAGYINWRLPDINRPLSKVDGYLI